MKDHYHLIYKTIKQIPKGKVATFGEIAQLCGLTQPRFVGYALRALPPDTDVPWHRVVNKLGKISFPKFTLEYKRQKERLLDEGIVFRDRETYQIDFEKYGWLNSLKKKYER